MGKHVVTEVINLCHEVDLLEAHLDEHQHFIDRIVIVESEKTYTGMDKILYFEKNKERFARFNIEHEVLPAEFHHSIPASYGQDEHRKWVTEAKNNRERQQRYIFKKYKKDCDYICNTDVDEIWSRTRWNLIEECMDKEWCYIVPSVRRFFYYIDYLGSNSHAWRITRSDQSTHHRQKGTKRGSTMRVGWHFNSMFKDPYDLWMKCVGQSAETGHFGWSKVPDPDAIAAMLKRGIFPILNKDITKTSKKVMPLDDLSWLPPYMRENKDKWLWLPAHLREGRIISDWRVDI